LRAVVGGMGLRIYLFIEAEFFQCGVDAVPQLYQANPGR
jgi:hypothetical protein